MPVYEVITTGDALVRRLKARADRSVYEAQDGSFYVDYGGGCVAQSAIREAFKAGHIKLKWPDSPTLHHYILK